MLHESFQNPKRDVEVPPYELTEVGWGEFDIIVVLHFKVRGSAGRAGCQQEGAYRQAGAGTAPLLPVPALIALRHPACPPVAASSPPAGGRPGGAAGAVPPPQAVRRRRRSKPQETGASFSFSPAASNNASSLSVRHGWQVWGRGAGACAP